MEILIAFIPVVAGLAIGIVRIKCNKSGKSKKIKYYNYSKFEIKYKKIDEALSKQSKSII
jgi:hypothetical protein